MRKISLLLLFVSGLAICQVKYKSDKTIRLYLKKMNFSIEYGLFKQHIYYSGDLNAIEPIAFPITNVYLKSRFGYQLSPKLSVEYAFVTFSYYSIAPFKTKSNFFSEFTMSKEFRAYSNGLGIRYFFKSFSNDFRTLFFSWNPSLIFESYQDVRSGSGYSCSGQYNDTSRVKQLELANFFIRNELLVELYSKRSKTSWSLGFAYKFNPLFKTILSNDITYESEGKKRYANSSTNGSGLEMLFLRFTFYLYEKKPIKRYYSFSEND